jgi:hypothetical protein
MVDPCVDSTVKGEDSRENSSAAQDPEVDSRKARILVRILAPHRTLKWIQERQGF